MKAVERSGRERTEKYMVCRDGPGPRESQWNMCIDGETAGIYTHLYLCSNNDVNGGWLVIWIRLA